MRHESETTALSWIPSEAITGMVRKTFDLGITHYDQPPPEHLGDPGEDLETLRRTDRFRFANSLRAWIDVNGKGRVTGSGYSGGAVMGSSTVRLGGLSHNFEAVALPLIQHPPEDLPDDEGVRFIQTAGGRTGLPAPRRVRRKPFVQWQAPLVWTTLSLIIRTDGTTSFDVAGASRFPRHWVYDAKGDLARKSGMTDFKDWYRWSFGKHSPWGDEDSPALVTAVETALERGLSSRIMRGGSKPKIKKFEAGATLIAEGDRSDSLLLILDGVLRVEKGGERLAEYGPGALLGERAALEGGLRTSTLVAVTTVKVAIASANDLDHDSLMELAVGHRREGPPA